ncbi:MAG: DUF86 domain-containing protein [SAR202 cluster bacterium]|nr:DUF86 domain-containing protein [SAR202 cluster bacterium]
MRRDRECLLDIVDASNLIFTYMNGVTKDAFLEDYMLQDAVIRRLEIIGEATNRLSDDTLALDQEMPWHKIVGMRNALIHRYDDVDLDIVWKTATVDLPLLLPRLESLLHVLGRDP